MEMPQDEGLDSLVESALGGGEGSGQDTPQTISQDTGHADRLTTPQNPGAARQDAGQQARLLAGKYKTPQELEKAYQNSDKQAKQTLSKLQRLEQLIGSEKFQRLAQSDPDVREALAKSGYELRREESRQEAQDDDWDGDESDPRFQIELVKADNNLRWELFNFGAQRGKPLSPEEEKAIKEVLVASPRLKVHQAWKLTPNFEKELKAKEDARLSEMEKRFKPKGRPQPNPMALPGQKLDLKKSVTEMNDAEKRAYLSKIAEENP